MKGNNMRNFTLTVLFTHEQPPSHAGRTGENNALFLTCSRPDPSSKMGSSAVAVSSSVCILPLATPSLPYSRAQAAPTPVTSEGRDLPGGAASSVTPSAASRYPISRWRGLRQISIICSGFGGTPPPPTSFVSSPR